MSQTSTILHAKVFLEALGHIVLYLDLPRASRSGSGVQGTVALIFEHLVDRHPDLVSIDPVAQALFLFEVDVMSALRNTLAYKAQLYRGAADQLKREIGAISAHKLTYQYLIFVERDLRAISIDDAAPPMDGVLTPRPGGILSLEF